MREDTNMLLPFDRPGSTSHAAGRRRLSATLAPFGLTAALGAALVAPPLAAAAPEHDPASHHTDSALIEKVRQATASFRDARQVPNGYESVLGCVSGPNEGAMGVHFVNPALLTDAVLDAEHPEALTEPLRAAGVLRAARLGLARQPARGVR